MRPLTRRFDCPAFPLLPERIFPKASAICDFDSGPSRKIRDTVVG
jgi:hypothetical protein